MTTTGKIALGLGITAALGVGGFFGYRWLVKQRIPKLTVEGIDYVGKTIRFTIDGKSEEMGFGMGMKKNQWDISPYQATRESKVTGLEVKDGLGRTRSIVTI